MRHKKNSCSFVSCTLSLFHIYFYTINTDKHPLVCKCDTLRPRQGPKGEMRVIYHWISDSELIRSPDQQSELLVWREKRLTYFFFYFQHNRVNANFKNKFDAIQISRRSTRTQRRGWPIAIFLWSNSAKAS